MALIRRLSWWVVLFAVFLPVRGQEPEPPAKRVAVLYFEDRSGFDSPGGCGLPLGPLGRLFGSGRRAQERWNLSVGFRDMLVSTLQEAYGYAPVPPREVVQAFQELKIEPKQLKDVEVRRRLAERLNADVLLVGTIQKFKQERARGMYRRDIRGASDSQLLAGGAGAIGVMGAYYTASIEVDVIAYHRSGGELFSDRIEESKSHRAGAVLSGPIEASISGEGTRVYVSNEEVVNTAQERPVITSHEVMEHVRFGTPGWDRPWQPGAPPNYRDTLLGHVTQQVMDRIVQELRDQIGPALPGTESSEAAVLPAEGNIPFLLQESGDIFVNLGSDVDLRPGERLRVYRPGEIIRDLETGEELGRAETEVGLLEVIEVLRPKLSRTRIVRGEAKQGDIVRTVAPKLPAAASSSAEGDPSSPPSEGESR
ncbi:MAG: hypothetical protein KatS3mg115_0126 [Candidatus Poribacteria bacterium]|nr:MAG: hypothetical protein KatS3mg115_0126 [Candidatus Poribacteria bacterium]